MGKKWEGVVKIQRPICTNERKLANGCLVYDKTRKIEQIIVVNNRTLNKLFDEDEFKIYAVAKLDENGNMTVMKQVEEQGW